MKLITENEFKNTIETGITLIDFFAPWCGPCKAMATYLDKIETNHSNIKFAKIDTDECEEVNSVYQVRALPTVVLFKDGVEVDRIVGFTTKAVDELLRKAV